MLGQTQIEFYSRRAEMGGGKKIKVLVHLFFWFCLFEGAYDKLDSMELLRSERKKFPEISIE